MKRTTAILLLAVSLCFACGESKIINGKSHDTCGVVSMHYDDDCKDPHIRYKPSWGNIFWGCILVETVIAPVYFFGWSMFNPVGTK